MKSIHFSSITFGFLIPGSCHLYRLFATISDFSQGEYGVGLHFSKYPSRAAQFSTVNKQNYYIQKYSKYPQQRNSVQYKVIYTEEYGIL